MYYGAGMQGWLSLMGPAHAILRKILDVGLAMAAIILGVALALHAGVWWGRIGPVAWAFLLGLSLSMGRSYAGLLDFSTFAVLLISLPAHLCRRPSSVAIVPNEVIHESRS